MTSSRSAIAVALVALAAGCGETPESEPPARTFSPAAEEGARFVMAVRSAEGTVTETPFGGAQAQTLRQAGSHAKLVCAMAAVRLAEEGALSLDDTVGRWLPALTGPARAVTLHQLLQNRSGLADTVMIALMDDPSLAQATYSAEEAAVAFANGPLKQEPGAAFDYVNTNWILVQAILEKAGGAPLQALAERTVFEPARAATAVMFEGDLTGPDAAAGPEGSVPLPGFVTCAGGLATDAASLLAVVRGVYTSFDDAATETLTTVASPENFYALGGRYASVVDAEGNEEPISWQSGSNGDWESMVVYLPARDVGIALMTTSAGMETIDGISADWLEAQGLSLTP